MNNIINTINSIYNINNMPLTLVKLFNNHVIEFIDDICSIVDNKDDLLNIRKKIKGLIRISSVKPIKLWKENCSKYDIEIENKNYEYFLNKSYIKDIRNDDFLLNLFEKYKTQFSCESVENKEKIMQYIYNLNKISKIYYMSKTN